MSEFSFDSTRSLSSSSRVQDHSYRLTDAFIHGFPDEEPAAVVGERIAAMHHVPDGTSPPPGSNVVSVARSWHGHQISICRAAKQFPPFLPQAASVPQPVEIRTF